MNEKIYELGFIDTSIYNCITTQIDTDKVIIAEKQLDHIANRHPEAYDKILIELKSALADPDYIFKDDKHSDTGLVVRTIQTGHTHIHIVLKVCTNSNGGKLANSIISAWEISECRLNNYIRNKTLLYKKS